MNKDKHVGRHPSLQISWKPIFMIKKKKTKNISMLLLWQCLSICNHPKMLCGKGSDSRYKEQRVTISIKELVKRKWHDCKLRKDPWKFFMLSTLSYGYCLVIITLQMKKHIPFSSLLKIKKKKDKSNNKINFPILF